MADKYYSVNEFARKMSLTEEYVRQCCRKQRIGPSGSIAKLPEGYESKKEGRDWRIFAVKQERQSESRNVLDKPVQLDAAKLLVANLMLPKDIISKLSKEALFELQEAAEPIYAQIASVISEEELVTNLLRGWQAQASISLPIEFQNKVTLPCFDTGRQLLRQVREAYIHAVTRRKAVRMSVTIQNDGTHTIKLDQPLDDVLLSLAVVGEHSELEWFYVRAWMKEIAFRLQKNSANSDSLSLQVPEKRCLNCGRIRLSTRKNQKSRYCSERCKVQHNVWIKRLSSESQRVVASRLVKKLEKVRKNLFCQY